jgi:hypothetical protein
MHAEKASKPGLGETMIDPVADHAHRNGLRQRCPLMLAADLRVEQVLCRDLGGGRQL